VIFPADHVWQIPSPGWMNQTEGNEGNEASSKDQVSGSYLSDASLSSVKSFDLAVDPDVLPAEPTSKVGSSVLSPAAEENPASAHSAPRDSG
jgi:hypothetical protein